MIPSSPVKRSAGPPPPPPGKNNLTIGNANKLQRSPQMANLYRLLRNKLESNGSVAKNSAAKNSTSRQNSKGNTGGIGDALAEKAKRSQYFQKIEEDCIKYKSSILEIQTALVAFRTTNMTELLKFHQYVEDHLKNLSDERQVLLRFEAFPFEKLETLRMAAKTYHQLEEFVSTLKGWEFTAPSGKMPVSDQLDKIESYCKKIEKKITPIERDKEKELKNFQSQNLTFDYKIITRIKEEMVDVSSRCIEMALKESKQKKESGKAAKLRRAISSMLWRVFQFAFTIYTFAGGQDDRADKLSAELACELQTYIID
ncbi:uncharacterized protein At4g04980-like [Carex rostrata]